LNHYKSFRRYPTHMRIFFIGRPHIDDESIEIFSKAGRISISPTQDDIKNYLEIRLKSDTTVRTRIEEKCARTLELPLLVRRLLYSFCFVSTVG